MEKDINKVLDLFFRHTIEKRNHAEDSKIFAILKFMNIPEKSNCPEWGIPDFLSCRKIFIFMPTHIFNSIDWSEFDIPSKLKFCPNHFSDKTIVLGDITAFNQVKRSCKDLSLPVHMLN